jgi:hypothetical protein
MKHTVTSYIRNMLASIACEVVKPLKISFILGSKAAFFSLSQCSFPLIGAFSRPHTLIPAFFIRIAYALVSGLGIYTALIYHIPTLCGAFYLSTSSKFVRIALPMLCIGLFLLHPVGAQASVYTLYWLIPLITALYAHRSFFLQAVGSTFTTHAVGSVLWLYTHPTDATLWHTLLGIVWAERFIFAACMTGLYYGIRHIQSYSTSVKGTYAYKLWH